MDEYQYEVRCILCSTETTIYLEGEDEAPAYCPMCGSEAIEVESIDFD